MMPGPAAYWGLFSAGTGSGSICVGSRVLLLRLFASILGTCKIQSRWRLCELVLVLGSCVFSLRLVIDCEKQLSFFLIKQQINTSSAWIKVYCLSGGEHFWLGAENRPLACWPVIHSCQRESPSTFGHPSGTTGLDRGVGDDLPTLPKWYWTIPCLYIKSDFVDPLDSRLLCMGYNLKRTSITPYLHFRYYLTMPPY